MERPSHISVSAVNELLPKPFCNKQRHFSQTCCFTWSSSVSGSRRTPMPAPAFTAWLWENPFGSPRPCLWYLSCATFTRDTILPRLLQSQMPRFAKISGVKEWQKSQLGSWRWVLFYCKCTHYTTDNAQQFTKLLFARISWLQNFTKFITTKKPTFRSIYK